MERLSIDSETIFAEILRDLLIERNLNARTLALSLGIKNSTITRYLNEQRLPTIEYLVKIADYFNCSTDYLLGFEDEIYPQTFQSCPPFAERIPFLLNYYKCSSYHIYHNAGISQVRYYSWKNGVNSPTLDNVIKIAKALNCTVDFVIGRTMA